MTWFTEIEKLAVLLLVNVTLVVPPVWDQVLLPGLWLVTTRSIVPEYFWDIVIVPEKLPLEQLALIDSTSPSAHAPAAGTCQKAAVSMSIILVIMETLVVPHKNRLNLVTLSSSLCAGPPRPRRDQPALGSPRQAQKNRPSRFAGRLHHSLGVDQVPSHDPRVIAATLCNCRPPWRIVPAAAGGGRFRRSESRMRAGHRAETAPP